MEKDLVYIASMNVNDFVKRFSEDEDLSDGFKFPKMEVGDWGEMIKKYFSFEGFYKIRNVNEKSIMLKKLSLEKLNKMNDLENRSDLSLTFTHNAALRSFAEGGVSLVEGEIYKRNFKGTISRIPLRMNYYRININEIVE